MAIVVKLPVHALWRKNNKWYYVDGNGKLVKGAQVINGNHYYFNNDYSQVKGAWANGRYYDGDSGQAVTNRFVQVGANKWAYLNQNGQKVVGLQHINGKLYLLWRQWCPS